MVYIKKLLYKKIKKTSFNNKPQDVFDKKLITELVEKFPEQQIYPHGNYHKLFEFLGINKFFSFLIPEKYGGKVMYVEEMSNILTFSSVIFLSELKIVLLITLFGLISLIISKEVIFNKI